MEGKGNRRWALKILKVLRTHQRESDVDVSEGGQKKQRKSTMYGHRQEQEEEVGKERMGGLNHTSRYLEERLVNENDSRIEILTYLVHFPV